MDMSNFRFLCKVESLSSNQPTGKGLKSQRSHELHGAPCHDDLNSKSIFDQQAHQFDRFITRNPAGNAEYQSGFFLGISHGLKYPINRDLANFCGIKTRTALKIKNDMQTARFELLAYTRINEQSSTLTKFFEIP